MHLSRRGTQKDPIEVKCWKKYMNKSDDVKHRKNLNKKDNINQDWETV